MTNSARRMAMVCTEELAPNPERPDNDPLLKLYALHKQATDGDVNGPKPGLLDFASTAKYEAWSQVRGMQPDETRQKHIELVRQLGRELPLPLPTASQWQPLSTHCCR